MNGEDPLLVLRFNVPPPHSLKQAQMVFLDGFGVALSAELAHFAVRAEEEGRFFLMAEHFYVAEDLLGLRDEGGEGDLGSCEFPPVDDLPMRRHVPPGFPHNGSPVGQQQLLPARDLLVTIEKQRLESFPILA